MPAKNMASHSRPPTTRCFCVRQRIQLQADQHGHDGAQHQHRRPRPASPPFGDRDPCGSATTGCHQSHAPCSGCLFAAQISGSASARRLRMFQMRPRAHFQHAIGQSTDERSPRASHSRHSDAGRRIACNCCTSQCRPCSSRPADGSSSSTISGIVDDGAQDGQSPAHAGWTVVRLADAPTGASPADSSCSRTRRAGCGHATHAGREQQVLLRPSTADRETCRVRHIPAGGAARYRPSRAPGPASGCARAGTQQARPDNSAESSCPRRSRRSPPPSHPRRRDHVHIPQDGSTTQSLPQAGYFDSRAQSAIRPSLVATSSAPAARETSAGRPRARWHDHRRRPEPHDAPDQEDPSSQPDPADQRIDDQCQFRLPNAAAPCRIVYRSRDHVEWMATSVVH